MFAQLLVIVLIALVWLWYSSKRPRHFPPGPKWFPIVGNIPLIAKKLSKFGFHHLVWDDLVKNYGPIVGLKLGKKKVILVSGKDLIKEVSTRDEFEGRPDGFYWNLRSRWNRLGVVFVDGPLWVEQRRFSIQHLKMLGYGRSAMEQLIANEATSLIEWLEDNSSLPMDMTRSFDIPVLNVIWAMIAGKRYPREDKTLREICDIIHTCFKLLDSSGGLLEQIPMIRFIAPKLTGYSALVDIHKCLWKFLGDTIDEHKKTIQPGITRDFIDAYLHKMKLVKDEDSTFNDDQLLVLCLDFLQAGTDTTSNTLAFIILYMINYPDVQQKFQHEIDTVVGKIRKPRLDDRSKMPYVSAVIQEVQRIATIAPVGVPHRVCRTTNLRGYLIPKDTTVLLLMYNMHMDKHWKDPYNFRPERFLSNDGQLIQDDWFGIFGYGKRKCIGENLAKSNLFLFTTYIFQKFKVAKERGEPAEPLIEMCNGITLSPKPYKAVFIDRI